MHLILPSLDVERTKAFYDVVHRSLVQEQHGAGPVHYSFRDGALDSVEIYPVRPAYREHTIVLGLFVRAGYLERLVPELCNCGGTVLDEIKRTSQGVRVRMEDPDGRMVEITEVTE